MQPPTEPAATILQTKLISLVSSNSGQTRTTHRQTVPGAIAFRCKAAVLQARQAVHRIIYRDVKRFKVGAALADQPAIAMSETPLWTQEDEAERFLTAGKVRNLRIATRRLNGVEIPSGAIFSFWAHIGRPSRFKGYVVGRELREGCIIPTIGGGLCQLSNALYDAALTTGLEIVERHAHTQVIPGSLAESGRDATVFWNYVDLRFRSDEALRIEAEVDEQFLRVRFRASRRPTAAGSRNLVPLLPRAHPVAGNCATCGVADCFRSTNKDGADGGKTA
ncbi:MAG TPA: VanW family protein [Blastocatellia bacterium]|nr:VanW family protein [Blastocatellia bacterium]